MTDDHDGLIKLMYNLRHPLQLIGAGGADDERLALARMLGFYAEPEMRAELADKGIFLVQALGLTLQRDINDLADQGIFDDPQIDRGSCMMSGVLIGNPDITYTLSVASRIAEAHRGNVFCGHNRNVDDFKLLDVERSPVEVGADSLRNYGFLHLDEDDPRFFPVTLTMQNESNWEAGVPVHRIICLEATRGAKAEPADVASLIPFCGYLIGMRYRVEFSDPENRAHLRQMAAMIRDADIDTRALRVPVDYATSCCAGLTDIILN